MKASFAEAQEEIRRTANSGRKLETRAWKHQQSPLFAELEEGVIGERNSVGAASGRD